MEYKIVEGTIDELEDKVNDLIKEGWKPQGGVSPDVHLSRLKDAFKSAIKDEDMVDGLQTGYVQAMIR